MRRLAAIVFAAILLIPTTASATTLYDYFASYGNPMPTLSARAGAAKDCAIVSKASEYKGTVGQNTQLLKCLTSVNVPVGPQDGLLGALVTKPFTFVPGTVIRSSDVNANFDTLYSLVNGNIENVNISAGANIAPSKILGTAIVSTPTGAQILGSSTTIMGSFTVNGGLVVSTTAGTVRVPSLTTVQRDALTAALGDIIYNISAGQFQVFEGGVWIGITPVGVTATSTLIAKGVVELATGAEAAAHALAGSGNTDAALVLHTGISSSTGASNIVPITDTRGVLGSTFGGTTSSLATTDSSGLVVQNPTNATSTPTAAKIPIADANGKLDSWISIASRSLVAGEAITGATTPVAVYIDAATNTVKISDGDDPNRVGFDGFAVSTAAALGNAITVQTAGYVTGFTTLTSGTEYFVANDRTVSSTPGSFRIRVGIAVSTSTILLQRETRTWFDRGDARENGYIALEAGKAYAAAGGTALSWAVASSNTSNSTIDTWDAQGSSGTGSDTLSFGSPTTGSGLLSYDKGYFDILLKQVQLSPDTVSPSVDQYYFIGVSPTVTGAATNVQTTKHMGLFIKYTAGVGGALIRTVSAANGVTQSSSTAATAFDFTTVHDYRLTYSNGTFKVYVDTVLQGTVSTNLPTGTAGSNMGVYGWKDSGGSNYPNIAGQRHGSYAIYGR